jgi:2-polyprenyl-3-methyl-5-hydroxy-6-metoxy-1,4-benzoquinol methylase
MVHHNICPICSSEDIDHFLITPDHFLSKEIFSLFKCSQCGFVFTQDSPEESDIEKYYESIEYVSHNDSAAGFSNMLYRFSRNFMLKKKRNIIRKSTLLEKGKLLDIGSGTGHFLSEMKYAGWDVKGIEINKKAREYSESRYGIEVLPPSEISVIPSGSLDCITMWHVLEHFENPYEYMVQIQRLLKPDGILIIALPNCSSFDAVHYKECWAAYDVPRHLWHFNSTTFRIFSEKTGFSILSTQNLPLDVFYISILSEKYKGMKLNFISGMVKGLWFSLLSSFKKESSSSLIYLLRKQEPNPSLHLE